MDKSQRATQKYKKATDRKTKATNKIKDTLAKAKNRKGGMATTGDQSKIKRLRARAARQDKRAGKIADRAAKKQGSNEVTVTAKNKAKKAKGVVTKSTAKQDLAASAKKGLLTTRVKK